ncbi:hypothetical protein N7541_006430 [Penicillium brevicompactum]|uniref:Uncharacterized protein n=1 Tax=Penicillium brevicompactum TaxID=5074 RepID=A0A9W9R551_PENBR|nr:hypothetical protein N7541_006430 [Penicillium brevicompactum]
MEGIEAGNLVESDELVLDDKSGSRTRFQIKADIRIANPATAAHVKKRLAALSEKSTMGVLISNIMNN